MPITLERALKHQHDWTTILTGTSRSSWPSHLFHTCQLEVAVEILRMGKIVCRNGVSNLICDVANQGALWNNPQAHNFVRLYFRPRTWFHLKTEGIKSTTDPKRVNPHMSIPVAFAFDFAEVMTSKLTGFVDGNFARTSSDVLTGDAEFDALDFNWIYHDAALPRERVSEVNNIRMSEVVVQHELSLAMLDTVICRTVHEERTLRHMLGRIPPPKIAVEQKNSIFMRMGSFVDEISWAGGVLQMKFRGPTYSTKPEYEVCVECIDGGISRNSQHKLAPNTYSFPHLRASKDALWTITIEGCLAYRGPVPSLSGLVT